MGVALRGGRRVAGWTQQELADRIGVSQGEISRLERGLGHTASLETWACAGAALGCDLVAYLEASSGATLPRDYEHLKRQQLVLERARTGGWTARPEADIDRLWRKSRSVDILLERVPRHELGVVEIWDFFDDVGEAWRGLDGKVAAVRRLHPDHRVGGLLVVRRTQRNVQLVREFGALFRAKFPTSIAWLRAIEADAAMPETPGFVWTDVRGTRLISARL
jgi:transcriptional regulator with XRE-family HTH domain